MTSLLMFVLNDCIQMNTASAAAAAAGLMADYQEPGTVFPTAPSTTYSGQLCPTAVAITYFVYWQYVVLVVVLWRPALSSAFVTALR